MLLSNLRLMGKEYDEEFSFFIFIFLAKLIFINYFLSQEASQFLDSKNFFVSANYLASL
jgi:hypothetical protein